MDGAKITGAEEVQVVEHMIEVVDLTPLLVARHQQAALSVCPVERTGESAKELRHGNIRFGVSHINGRIDQNRSSVLVRHKVPTPEIPVQKRRMVRLREQLLQTVQQSADTGVFAVIVPFAYVIMALINNGKYIFLYEMDDKGLLQRQLRAERTKALAWIAAMAGLGTGNLSMAGAGIVAATSTTLYITFGSVKSIKPKKKHNVIHVRESLTLYQVYASAEEFDFVLDYIRAHCPKVK